MGRIHSKQPKSSTRTKRRTGTRKGVLSDSKILANWQPFLRLEENKQELFKFLAAACITIKTSCTITSSIENSAITNGSYNMSFIAPSNQEETDTRMLLHAKDASQSGIKKVLIYAVDVVLI